MEFYIRGFAETRKQILDKLDNHTPECMIHLGKIWRYPNCESRKHWMKEVWLCFQSTNKQKSNNKRPTSNSIFEYTWGRNKDACYDYFEVSEDYIDEESPDPIRSSQFSQFYKATETYFQWLSKALSSQNIVRRDQVIAKLEELGF